MTDTPPVLPGDEVDVVALASDVRRALNESLRARGLDSASPEVRAAIVAALSERPVDRKLTAAEKQAHALELRYAGGTYREIAEMLGYKGGPGGAYKAVMRGLESLKREPAEALRTIAIERLESILAGGLYRAARGGDLKAIDRVVRVMREQRRYVPGLEVPVSAELTGAGGGAIIVELNLPAPVIVTPIPQGELGGIILDLDDDAVVSDVLADASSEDPDDPSPGDDLDSSGEYSGDASRTAAAQPDASATTAVDSSRGPSRRKRPPS